MERTRLLSCVAESPFVALLFAQVSLEALMLLNRLQTFHPEVIHQPDPSISKPGQSHGDPSPAHHFSSEVTGPTANLSQRLSCLGK